MDKQQGMTRNNKKEKPYYLRLKGETKSTNKQE